LTLGGSTSRIGQCELTREMLHDEIQKRATAFRQSRRDSCRRLLPGIRRRLLPSNRVEMTYVEGHCLSSLLGKSIREEEGERI